MQLKVFILLWLYLIHLMRHHTTICMGFPSMTIHIHTLTVVFGQHHDIFTRPPLVKLEILFSCILSVYLQHNASIALPGVVPFEKLYCFTFLIIKRILFCIKLASLAGRIERTFCLYKERFWFKLQSVALENALKFIHKIFNQSLRLITRLDLFIQN